MSPSEKSPTSLSAPPARRQRRVGLMPTDVGHRRHLGVFHRFINLAESGWLDLASIVSRRIKRDEVNDGIALTARADGVRIVIV